MTVPSFSFSLKDVADLAARLSVQIASQHGLNRHQSMASILSDAGIPATSNPLSFSVSNSEVAVLEYFWLTIWFLVYP